MQSLCAATAAGTSESHFTHNFKPANLWPMRRRAEAEVGHVDYVSTADDSGTCQVSPPYVE